MTWSWNMVLDIAWLLFLLLLLIYFLQVKYTIRKTRHWHIACGQITVCEWRTEAHRPWPTIEYTYQVGGQTYTGEQFFLEPYHNDPNSAHAKRIAYKVAVAYKQNKSLDVYYDPDHPEIAVLDRTVPIKLNVIILLLSGLISVQLIIMGHALF